MMAEKPILFSSEMVRAILEGRKTQTRRVIKPQPIYDDPIWLYGDDWFMSDDDMQSHLFHEVYGNGKCPYGGVYTGGMSDFLWVRETFSYITKAENEFFDKRRPDGCPVEMLYRADGYEIPATWTPSIFMPRWASRILLRVTDVGIERLQDITDGDAKRESIVWSEAFPEGYVSGVPGDNRGYGSAYFAFRTLWDSINAKRGYPWNRNPWVWVVEFELATESELA